MTTRARDAGPLVREIEHTADLGFEVEAPTLEALFERAGLGLTGFMVDLAAVAPRTTATFAVAADGLAELLHDFLQALLVRLQTEGFVAAELAVRLDGTTRVEARATGEALDPARHGFRGELKAVTYHELAVRERPGGGWWARVIVDV